MSHPHFLAGFLALVLAIEPGLGEIQAPGDYSIIIIRAHW